MPMAAGGARSNKLTQDLDDLELIETLKVEKPSMSLAELVDLVFNYLNSRDPWKVKFFDEAGEKLPYVGRRSYGHNPIGMRWLRLLGSVKVPTSHSTCWRH